MSLIRPDVKAKLWLWREPLVGAALSALGLLWVFTERGLVFWVGVALALVGGLAIWTGLQRLRFRVGDGGPGVVQVTERQVTYFGPDTGGAVSIDALSQVALAPGDPFNAWVLTESTGVSLEIPTHAEGADALFDVFSALDGIRTEHMLAQLKSPPKSATIIWQAARPTALPRRTLH